MTAFADGEAETLFHGDRADELDSHLDVVARHDHFNTFRQFDRARNVRRTEVELRTIALEERGVTAAFFLRQDVDFALEVGVRGVIVPGLARTWPRSTSSRFVPRRKDTDVVTGFAFVQELAEHFDARAGRLRRRLDTDDFDFVANADDTTFNTTRHNSTTAGDREHVFDRHKERLVHGAFRRRDVGVELVSEGEDGRFADRGLVAFESRAWRNP